MCMAKVPLLDSNADHYTLLGLPQTATADEIRQAYFQLARNFFGPGFRYDIVTLNGAPALLQHDGSTVASAIWLECEGDRITAIHALRHPGKLARLLPVTKALAGTSLH